MTYRYSDERRNNPELRAKVVQVIAARNAALQTAAVKLREVLDEMRDLRLGEDDAIYERCFDSVWSAYMRVSNDAHFVKGFGSETYIGNLAASELGEYLQGLDTGADKP